MKKHLLLIISLTFICALNYANTFALASYSFYQGKAIPRLFTCDGKNISPELHWTDAPVGTRSYVLIMTDPDASMGEWDHWLLFNIPVGSTQLLEGVKPLPKKTRVGRNSWNKMEYGGPCPPKGKHSYLFTVYAIDTTLHLPNGIKKIELEHGIRGHILARTKLVGFYRRKT